MNCLMRVAEWLGVYEPVLDLREAKSRLAVVEEEWKQWQAVDRRAPV